MDKIYGTQGGRLNRTSVLVLRLVAVLLLLLILASLSTGNAQQVPESGKLHTEDAPAVLPGDFELELTYHHTTQSFVHGRPATLLSQRLNLAGTVGFLPSLDGSVCWGSYRLARGSDHSDSQIGYRNFIISMKYEFWHGKNARMSYVPGFTIPAGMLFDTLPARPEQEYWSFDQLVVFTTYRGSFSYSADAGIAIPVARVPGNVPYTLAMDWAGGYQVNRFVQPILEINSFLDIPAATEAAYAIATTAGAIIKASKSIRLDVGIQQVLLVRNADRVFRLTVNLSWTL